MSTAQQMLDHLRTKGWKKHSLGLPEGPNCLLGARQLILGGYHPEFVNELERIIIEQFPERVPLDHPFSTTVATFNDHHLTKFEDIELVLEKLRAEGY